MKKYFEINNYESFEEFRIPFGKRLFDIIFSFLAIVLFSPLMLIAILLIKIESKGSLFYISKRAGTGFDIFDFYKFRSMFEGSETKRAELSEFNQYLINIHNKGEEEEQDVCPECKKLGYPCSPILYIDGNQICENFYLHKKRLHTKKATFFKVKNDPRVTKVGKILRRFHMNYHNFSMY
jgi:lipopolysaccharide/colanic/teichoic acid biosynthesis glycosyltransferase